VTDRSPRRRANGVALERIQYDPDSWSAVLATRDDADVFHTVQWLNFLRESQGAEPVIAAIRVDEAPAGYFVGAIVKRFGVRILGSPLRGWATESMGFLVEPGVDRRSVADALALFAFRELGCVHVELSDRHLTTRDMDASQFQMEAGRTFRLNIEPPEETVFGGIRRTTRQEIRKAVRAGLQTEVATDAEFVDEFYGFLTATFARQGLAPTYRADRVHQLRRALEGGHLLLLRVRAPDGRTIGTSISVGLNRRAYAWGMAFDRENQEHHAIELLWWETIRHWRSRGATMFDFGGGGEYKAKYGGELAETLQLNQSRWPVVQMGRSAARRMVRLVQIARARRIG
jgi:CelD/BcsL family acetyltransferase involved in cellulose biosynthesis